MHILLLDLAFMDVICLRDRVLFSVVRVAKQAHLLLSGVEIASFFV